MADHDPVNSPSHYVRNGIELADVIDAWDLSRWLTQAVQYIFRANLKGSRLENLRKARVYIDREIAMLEPTSATEPGPLPCGVCEQAVCKAGGNPECTEGVPRLPWQIMQQGDCSTLIRPADLQPDPHWADVACVSCRRFYSL